MIHALNILNGGKHADIFVTNPSFVRRGIAENVAIQ